MLELQDYTAANWVTDQGVAKKLKLISKNGLPSLRNAKRLTFTTDRNLFENELDAALSMLSQFPKFIRQLKSSYESYDWGNGKKREFPPYVMWIEFHADGWMHFHMDWLCRHSLPLPWFCNSPDVCENAGYKVEHAQSILTRLWAIGNVHITNINRHRDNYAFKYAFKPEGQDDAHYSYALPDWFLDAQWTELVKVKVDKGLATERTELVEKIKTFRRLRMWRASKGFYESPPPAKYQENTEKKTSEVPRTVRDHFDSYEKKIVVVARGPGGKYLQSFVIETEILAGKIFNDAIRGIIKGETYATKRGLIVNKSLIQNNISKNKRIELNKLWQLHQLPKR